LDNITHSLFGWTLARSGAARDIPYATATLIIASNAPDADIVTAFTGGGLQYLAAHRGPTHGPLGFLGLGLLTASFVFLYARYQASRRRVPLVRPLAYFGRLCAVAVAGVIIHALMDLPTSYGTRLLSPFLPTWYAFDWMPIIDIYLLVVLAGGLLAARGRRLATRARVAQFVLVITALDYAGRAVLHDRALARATSRTASGVAAPCLTHPTLTRHPSIVPGDVPADTCVQAAALPTFVSPFEFRVVRQYPRGYEISQQTLLHDGPVPALWIDTEDGPVIERAAETRTGRVFLSFSRFPAADVETRQSGERVVRFIDLRFIGTPLRLEARPQPRVPSAITIWLDGRGHVLAEHLGG
jgi:membrane-bound metal-dependent hydrolase YbcI (DUF457 family)